MVMLFTSHHCVDGDHELCDGGHKCEPGHYGGSVCTCPCHHMTKEEIKRYNENMKRLRGD